MVELDKTIIKGESILWYLSCVEGGEKCEDGILS